MNVLNNAIPWIFGSAVFLGGVKMWWMAKAKLDRLYPERPADPNANFFVKALNSFQNELLAALVVFVMLFSMTMAGKVAWFFVGKTTVATAAHATILGAEGLGGLFTSAADVISEFDGGGVTPEEMDKLIEEKSIFSDKESDKQSFYVPEQPNYSTQSANYAPAANYAPGTAPLAAANANAPIAPAGSAVVGQPGPVESVVVAEQVAAPAPAAPVAAAAPGNQYAVGNVVTVLPGDSLFKIAQRAYGDGELWRSICNANRGAIGNCDNLQAGMQLTIPAPTYGEQVVSLVTNSENNPVAAAPAAAPQGLASDGRVYYDVAIPTPVPASVAVGTTMNQTAPQQPVVQDNTQIAASNTILKPVVYDTTSLTPVPASVAVQAVQPTATSVQVATTADLMGKPSVDTGPAPISASN